MTGSSSQDGSSKRGARNNEDELGREVRRRYDVQRIPPKAQVKLEEAYAALRTTPQNRPASQPAASTESRNAREGVGRHAPARRAVPARGKGRAPRVVKRGVVVAVAAVLVVLLCGTAFAASRLLQMQPGETGFFETGGNLPVYDSLKPGVSSLNAPVGDTVDVEGVQVTLDSVSCDRNVVNLFFTLTKEGGFDLAEQSNYEGSQENEWSRLQRLSPRFGYALTSNGEAVGTGSVNLLDAYREGDAVKVMQRIVPETTLPDQVDIALEGWAPWAVDAANGKPSFSLAVGMDLSTVAQPRELGAQDLVFSTSEGDKTIGIQRFTASELGCVMVVRNDNAWTGEPGTEGSSYGPPDNVLSPHALKVVDDQGNVLTPVGAGDGSGGTSMDGPQVIEFANLSPDAKAVTFTPMTSIDWESLSVDERKARNEANVQHVDVSQVGAQLPTSEYGGYELTGWDVSDGTVSISLEPYGWQANGSYMELVSEQEATLLESTWTDPDTGETGKGYHSGILFRKRDYLTGAFVQMVSYYAAQDEELRGLTQYSYLSAFDTYREETDAAVAVPFA